MKIFESDPLSSAAPAVRALGDSVTPTMKAVRIHAFGDSSVIRYEDAPRPEPAAGEVLVQVHAAGVNPVDWKVREGQLEALLHHSLPLTLGWDVSGVVAEIGSGVSQFKSGDEVYGLLDVSRNGAHAEYVAVPESDLALKPKSLHHVHAAAVPVAALTAWQALFETADLKAGQHVLIHGAAGGVGHLAVQLAKWKGARVIATASAKKHEWLRGLGADELIDYTAQPFETGVGKADVVLDGIGGETQERSWLTLKPGGILVSLVSPPSAEKAEAFGVRATFVVSEGNSARLTQIAELIDDGKLKPVVERIIPLSEAHRAYELSQTGHTRGKIVLRVKDCT